MAKVLPISPEVGRAVCAEPEHLPLVDAAHLRPGGPAARAMAKQLCAPCPVQALCLEWAMAHAEIGVWAGTSPNKRNRAKRRVRAASA